MALSIKNTEAENLVRELATLRGVSLVTAITQSAQETLDRDRATADRRISKKGLADRLMKIARETGPLMNNGKPSKELFDELYDEETGLPK